MVEEVRDFLGKLRFEEYIADALVQEGVDDMETSVLLDDNGLAIIVPQAGYRKRLQAALKQAQGQVHGKHQADAARLHGAVSQVPDALVSGVLESDPGMSEDVTSVDGGAPEVPIGTAVVEEVRDFLVNLRLHEVADAMVQEGFDDMETVLPMDDEDVTALVPKAGHRKRLQAALAKMQGQVQERKQVAASAGESRRGSDLPNGTAGLSVPGLPAGEGEDVAVAGLSAEAGVTVAATLARKNGAGGC